MVSINLQSELSHDEKPLVDRVEIWFLRIMAALTMWSALSYWAALLGIGAADGFRFDTADPQVRTLYASLAVVFPIASLGLWLLTRWGTTIWIIGLVAEIVAFGFVGEPFENKMQIAIINAGVLLAFAVVLAATLYQRLREREQIR